MSALLPKADKQEIVSGCPLCANRDLMRRSKSIAELAISLLVYPLLTKAHIEDARSADLDDHFLKERHDSADAETCQDEPPIGAMEWKTPFGVFVVQPKSHDHLCPQPSLLPLPRSL
jgi:hypothetical protein